MNDLISIIIPIYNTSEYLRACFDSIINQDYGNFEVILINDGSTDKSPEICEEYALKDKRFSVFHQQNKGVSAARNRGLLEVKGDYICFIDSDDRVEENFLSYLLSLIKSYDAKIVTCTLFQNKKKTDYVIPIKSKVNALKSIFNAQKGIRGYIGAKLFCADIIKEKKLLFNEAQHISEDTMFIYDYLCLCEDNCNVVVSGKVLYRCSYRENSATGKVTSEKKFNVNWTKALDALDILIDRSFDKSLKKSITLSKVTQTVTLVRAMIRCDYEDKEYIKKNIWFIQKNLMPYLFSNHFPFKKKVLAVLVGLFPFLFK